MKTSVSLLTVSQYERLPFLRILAKQITKQTSAKIIEWVILDGSKTDEDQHRLHQAVHEKEFFSGSSRNIALRYISMIGDPNRCIGHLRNVANQHVRGDIIVCMDDDDFYPPDRVTATIKAFRQHRSAQLAGCCNHIIYDPDMDLMFQFTVFAPNHTVNTCMAYRREYIAGHAYADHKTFAEEDEWTRGFTEKMAPVPPKSSVLQICHPSNTYNKRTIMLNNLCYSEEKRYCHRLNMKLEDVIRDADIRLEFLNLFGPVQRDVHDITFYCGHLSIPWDPRDGSLGGSEHAVVELCSELVRLGLRVQVYGTFIFEGEIEHRGVWYRHYGTFRIRRMYKVLVLWRFYGMHPLLDIPTLQAEHLAIDLHDNIPQTYTMIQENDKKISKVCFKSQFHRYCYEHVTQKPLPEEKQLIVGNGIRISTFSKDTSDQGHRNPFRCCYASCYTRGLLPLLKYAWPIIRHLEPRAELHVYYGMGLIQEESLKEEITRALQQPGVTDHGRCTAEVVAQEKTTSNLHLYYTAVPGEIDCISIRESLVAGCIPIISSTNLFGERDGLHFNGNPDDPKSYPLFAKEVVSLMHKPESELEGLRDHLRKSKTIFGWDIVAKEWATAFKLTCGS